jgi:hypothetical protein
MVLGQAEVVYDLAKPAPPEMNGFVVFGSIHSHNTMGAFHSGTDNSDEFKFDGLHITIGKLDATSPEYACRWILGGKVFTASIADVLGVAATGDPPSANVLAQWQAPPSIALGWEESLIDYRSLCGKGTTAFSPSPSKAAEASVEALTGEAELDDLPINGNYTKALDTVLSRLRAKDMSDLSPQDCLLVMLHVADPTVFECVWSDPELLYVVRKSRKAARSLINWARRKDHEAGAFTKLRSRLLSKYKGNYANIVGA